MLMEEGSGRKLRRWAAEREMTYWVFIDVDGSELRVVKESGGFDVDGRLAPALTTEVPLRIDQPPKCWACKKRKILETRLRGRTAPRRLQPGTAIIKGNECIGTMFVRS